MISLKKVGPARSAAVIVMDGAVSLTRRVQDGRERRTFH